MGIHSEAIRVGKRIDEAMLAAMLDAVPLSLGG